MKHLAILLLLTGAAWADLAGVKAEQNLEKRSELALTHATNLLKTARTAYDAGQIETVKAEVAEAREAVTLSLESLDETGKDPRRKSKYFKRAEIRTRALLRDVKQFSEAMNYADRPLLEPLEKELRRVNEALVQGIMGVRRKE